MVRLRAFNDRVNPESVLVGEAYVPKWEELMRYYGPSDNGVHLPFNFFLVMEPARSQLKASVFRDVIAQSERALVERSSGERLAQVTFAELTWRYGGPVVAEVTPQGQRRELSEYLGDGTNNIAELVASAIEAGAMGFSTRTCFPRSRASRSASPSNRPPSAGRAK